MKALILSCGRSIDPWLLATAAVVIVILVLGSFAAGAAWGHNGEEP
jgi:hypothetical protein